MIQQCKHIIENYHSQIDRIIEEIEKQHQTLREIECKYENDMFSHISTLFQAHQYYKVTAGYIKVDSINKLKINSLIKHDPIITVCGFYIRGAFRGDPYGYYDNDGGFLLSEFEPVTEEVFLENMKKCVETTIEQLPYKPDYLYRCEGDVFDNLLHDAKKAGIDVQYYPEIKVSLINKED